MASEHFAHPNWRSGLEIFASRPLSLIAALILAVVICVVSFMLLTFPVIAGYYYAVRQSKREEYFIDLYNIFRTSFLLLGGIKRYFVQSYLLGLTGLLPAAALYVALAVPLAIDSEAGTYAIIGLMILQPPAFFLAFFLAGVVVFHGYPRLIATNDAIGSLRYAISAGRARPLMAVARGFMLLFPIPGWILHFLMVFPYPFLTA